MIDTDNHEKEIIYWQNLMSILGYSGVINENEVKAMNDVETPHGKWWVPVVWICNLIKEARKEGRIADDFLMKSLIDVSNTLKVMLMIHKKCLSYCCLYEY